MTVISFKPLRGNYYRALKDGRPTAMRVKKAQIDRARQTLKVNEQRAHTPPPVVESLVPYADCPGCGAFNKNGEFGKNNCPRCGTRYVVVRLRHRRF